ncbi:MAG: hypothetical protein IJ158_00335 [Treponema sp.]|nr:hypothetical protein [Treponema sp.]
MHDYSIRGFSKINILYWLAVISVLVTPLISNKLTPIFVKISTKTGIAEIASLSVSSFLIFSVLWFLFAKLIWKIPLVTKILNVPDLSGEWKCEGIGKKYDDATINNQWDGMVVIEQTLDKILISTKTSKSTSHSTSVFGDLEKRNANEYVLTYMYENEPFVQEDGLHRHTGFCRLVFNIKDKTVLGNYYTDTDRGSYGTMKLTKQE